MNFLVRADASDAIGSGHVMRCLTLAHALSRQGAEVAFACRASTGDLCDVVASAGYALHALQAGDWQSDADATLAVIAKSHQTDWLVVDHYALGLGWERRLRPHVGKLLVINDLPMTDHDCDVLLDPNFTRRALRAGRGAFPMLAGCWQVHALRCCAKSFWPLALGCVPETGESGGY